MSGYIYLAECQGFHKIGWAAYSPERRMENLQVGNPFPITLVGCCYGFTKAREAELHWDYRAKHHRGEWFTLDADDVRLILADSVGTYGQVYGRGLTGPKVIKRPGKPKAKRPAPSLKVSDHVRPKRVIEPPPELGTYIRRPKTSTLEDRPMAPVFNPTKGLNFAVLRCIAGRESEGKLSWLYVLGQDLDRNVGAIAPPLGRLVERGYLVRLEEDGGQVFYGLTDLARETLRNEVTARARGTS